MYYDIKELIKKMKFIANVDSNIKLAKLFNVSYNTLNTWIKRNKFPQEVIFYFCKKFNCSLDYLIFNKEIKDSSLFNIQNEIIEFDYYGEYKKLNINYQVKLIIEKNSFMNKAFYLLNKDEIYFIAQALINPFTKEVKLIIDEDNNYSYELDLKSFKDISIGMIINML